MVVKADRGQNRTNIFWDTAPEQFEAEWMAAVYLGRHNSTSNGSYISSFSPSIRHTSTADI